METISFTISQSIAKPVSEVYKAITDTKKVTSYFCQDISGVFEEGKHVTFIWKFDGSELTEDFYIDRLHDNTEIVAHWKAWKVDYSVSTRFVFSTKDNKTVVTLTESGFHNDELGRESAFGQCQGWTHMLLCLKARLEFDIDLR